jgi:hypothetical protein
MSDELRDIGQIRVKGTRVGLVGLKKAFEQVSAESRAAGTRVGTNPQSCGNGEPASPGPEIAARLLELVGKDNYIAEAVRDDYRQALLREYKRFLGIEVPEEAAAMEIKVFGMSGCRRCSSLSEEVLDVMADLGIVADFEHVTDPNRFAELGPVAPPVVTRNGKIVSSGRTLNRARIEEILREV